MKKVIAIIFTISVLSNLMFAQEEVSYVEIQPDEFKSLVSKLVKVKRQKMSYQQYLMYRQIQIIKRKRRYQINAATQKDEINNNTTTNHSAAQLRKIEGMLNNLQRQQTTTTTITSDVSQRDLNNMKSDILDEINALKIEFENSTIQNNNEPVIVKVPEGNDENTALYEQLAKSMNQMNASIASLKKKMNNPATPQTNSKALENQIAQMNRNIQQLEKRLNNQKNTNNANQFGKELREIKNMIAQIDKSKSTHTKEIIRTNTNTTSNNTNTNYTYLKSLIKPREISNILFGNDSAELTPDSKTIIREVADLLKQHSQLDVLIGGYTSNKGDAVYNKDLSLRRTESVKQFLMELGVNSTTIFSESHGIDYNASSDINARRVEVKLLVRN